MNPGKIFEQSFARSVPDYALLYRLPDPAQSFGSNSYLRFSKRNPFDFLLWDSGTHILYALEMKTVKGNSISFERTKEESKEIHYYQIQGLDAWSKYDGIVSGFVIEFRNQETTVFIDIENFHKLIDSIAKKSFTLSDIENSGLPYIVIPQKKARTLYRYDIDYFLKKISDLKNGGN